MQPKDELQNGVDVLRPLLESRGFRFESGVAGRGSGGSFATGSYVKGPRRLNFSVRYSLGLVAYSFGDQVVSHEDYLRFIEATGNYPGFSQRIIDGFVHLKADLEEYFETFLSGTDSQLERLFVEITKNPPKKGFEALP